MPEPRLRGAALALALLFLPAVASAQISDTDKATARTLAQQGQDALDRRDFTTAADRFERALQIFPAPTLSLRLARAQVGLGKWIAAQETLNRVLRRGVPPGSPAAYEKAVADARSDLDALSPRIPSVVIRVRGAASPRVTVDGVAVPEAALGVSRLIDPGQHEIRAEAAGFVPTSKTVTVSERQSEAVDLELVPGAGPPPSGAPAPGGGSLRRTLGFAGVGVGGALLVMGAVTGGLAIPKHADLAKVCPGGHCGVDQQGAIDSYHLMTNLSTAGFVAGGVLAAAGVVLVVTAPRGGPRREAWVAPVVGPGFFGAQGGF